MLSRASEIAVSAMGYLAETYPEKGRRLSTADIARDRHLKKPFVAKVLTTLSNAGLIIGSPGPGGGYRLAREPNAITLKSIVKLFDSEERELACPYGPGYCGNGHACPLHDQFVSLRDSMQQFLEQTTLEGFQHCRPVAS